MLGPVVACHHTPFPPHIVVLPPLRASGSFLACDINKVALETENAWAACCDFILDTFVPRLPGNLSEHMDIRSKPTPLQLSSRC